MYIDFTRILASNTETDDCHKLGHTEYLIKLIIFFCSFCIRNCEKI